MDEIKRLTPAQRARCNRLIRLRVRADDFRKYFRRAVLPAGKVLCADIYRHRTRLCDRCGKPFAPSSNRQKYCPECGRTIRRKQKADSARRRRSVEH